VNVLAVSVSREVLRYDVGEHVGGREVCSFDGVPFTGITYEVDADADMLGALMELRVVFASWIAPWLSTKICWGSVALVSLSEHKQWGHCSVCLYRILPYNMQAYKERIHMVSFAASEAPMYSASTVEKATSGCLRARQVIAAPASMKHCQMLIFGHQDLRRSLSQCSRWAWWLRNLMHCTG